MSTSLRMESSPDVSPRFLARMAGVCQLLEAITATLGQVIIPHRLAVTDNPAATAANILGNARLYLCGFASSVLAVIFHVAWAFLMYDLLKPLHRRIATFATFVMLMGCAMLAVTGLLYIAPLLVLTGGSSWSAFTTEQSQAMAAMFLRLNAYAFDIHTVFFGFWCLLIGYLIYKSTFLPRILGVLFALAGLAWMLYLSPRFAVRLFPVIAAVSAIGEVPLEMWMIFAGLDEARWKEQASAARAYSYI